MAVSAAELEILIKAKDQASATLKQVSGNVKDMGRDIDSASGSFSAGIGQIGKWVAAAAAAIGVIAGLREGFRSLQGMIAEAGAEETGIMRLGASVSATGANWAEASAEIENYIQVQMRRGAIDDASARDAISRMTMVTGDYKTALSLLPLAMDLAAAKGMDLVSASELIGRVAEGNVGMLKRYGIVLREGATATEALTAMQKAFAGQAEAFASGYEGAMARYGAATGDLRETVGGPFKDLKTDILNSLADLAIQAGPYAQAFADAIAGGLQSLGQLAANAFYWGANIVQQFASGLGSGTSYIASVLNSIGDMISSWLSPGSPPKLLPDLDTWGTAAAQVYLDAFGKATPAAGMAGMAEQFAPMGDATLDPRFAMQLLAHERYVQDLKKRSKDKEKKSRDKDRADKSRDNKQAEMEAKRLHDAQLQYELSTADAAGQVAIMTRELGGVTKGSADYFNILTRLVGLNKQAANEEKRLIAARLQWELAQADKAGQVAIYRRELAKTTEGTLEWYDIATKIIQLQKAGGGGGAGALAGMLKPLKDIELPKITLPKINWEDVWGFSELGDPMKLPGLKTKLNDFGKELMALIVAGMKALPEQAVIWAADFKAWLTSTSVETAIGDAASDFGEWLVSNLGAYLGLSEPRALTAGSITAHVVAAVALATEGIVDAGASIGFGLIRGITRSLGSAKGSLLDAFLTGLMTTTSGELKKQIEDKSRKGWTSPQATLPEGVIPPGWPGQRPPAGFPGYASGGDFMVRQASQLLMVHQGERVQVTPAGKSGTDTITINSLTLKIDSAGGQVLLKALRAGGVNSR